MDETISTIRAGLHAALASPGAVRDCLRLAIGARSHEVFVCLWLDAQHRVVRVDEAFRGTLTQTSVYPREIVKTALATTDRRVRLYYANRDRDATIFRAELDRLAARHLDRLDVVHHLDVERGFVDVDAVRSFLDGGAGDGRGPAHHFVCGPTPFMDIVEEALLTGGVDADRIHIERFTPAEPALPPGDADAGGDADRAGAADGVGGDPGTADGGEGGPDGPGAPDPGAGPAAYLGSARVKRAAASPVRWPGGTLRPQSTSSRSCASPRSGVPVPYRQSRSVACRATPGRPVPRAWCPGAPWRWCRPNR